MGSVRVSLRSMKFLLFVLIQHQSAGIEKRFGSQVIALGRGHVRGLPLATKRFIVDATPGLGTHAPATVRKVPTSEPNPGQAKSAFDFPRECGVKELSPAARPIDGYYSAPKGLHYNVIRCSETSDR